MKQYNFASIALVTLAALLVIAGTSSANTELSGGTTNDQLNLKNSIAIGSGEEGTATANGFESIAIGDDAQSAGYQSMAIGSGGTIAKGDNSMAIGYEASAEKTSSMALGYQSTASGLRSLSVGSKAVASGQESIAIGSSNNDFGPKAEGYGSISIGSQSSATEQNAIALGYTAKANGRDSVVIGAQNASASGTGSTALGSYSSITQSYATAAGYSSNAHAQYATSLGSYAYASAEAGVALGSDSYAERNTSKSNVYLLNNTDVANTVVGNYGVVSIGNVSGISGYQFTRQLTGVAAGSEPTDAVNVAQLKGLGDAVAGIMGGNVAFGDASWDGKFYVGDKSYGSISEAIADMGTQSGGDPSPDPTPQPGGDLTLNEGSNINISKDGNEYTVSVSDNPTFNKVTANSINAGNVSMSQSGISMGGNKITGLADGGVYEGSKDAINGGQLWDAYQRMDGMGNDIYRRMDDLREDVNIVGAHAAALSGLHPIDYNPYEPTTLSAAIGTYRDEYAVAVGVFHYAKENVMFNLGASLCSDGDLMGRAGVSFTVGKSSDKPKVAGTMNGLRNQVIAMQAKLDELEEQNARNEDIIRQNMELIRELKAELDAKR